MTPDHCVRHNCFHEGLSVFAFLCSTAYSWISVTESSCKIPDFSKLFFTDAWKPIISVWIPISMSLQRFSFLFFWIDFYFLVICSHLALSLRHFSLTHRCLIRGHSLKLWCTGVQIHSQPLNYQTRSKQLTVFILIISCPALRIDVVCLLFSRGF